MTQEPLILSFDTATPHCSVALTRGGQADGEVVAAVTFKPGGSHSRDLLAAIDWLLGAASLTRHEIAAIAVGLGPGSFTGLRIGMATAKGLCHGSGIPLIGVSSLDAVGCAMNSAKRIAVVFDARKQEVYGRFYRTQDGRFSIPCSEPFVMSPQLLACQIEEPVLIGGDGVRVYREVFADALGDRLEVASASHRFPAAQTIGFLASSSLSRGRFLDVGGATPAYVRNSDAQLSLVVPKAQRKTAESTRKGAAE